MAIDNDAVLQKCIDEEYEKIPRLFKMGRIKRIIIFVLASLWLIATLIIGVYPWETPEIVWIRNNYMNYPFAGVSDGVRVSIVVNCFLFLILLWLEIIDLYDRAAFRKASSRALAINQHQRELERYADLKEKERLKKIYAELEIEEEMQKPGPRFCPKCGFLLPEDSTITTCQTCGTEYKE